MNIVPVTVRSVRVSGVPSLDSCTSIISSERSDSTIAEFNSTVQKKVMSDPIMNFGSLVFSVIEAGVGTTKNEYQYCS